MKNPELVKNYLNKCKLLGKQEFRINKNYTVAERYIGSSEFVEIPPVTRIMSRCFETCSTVKSVRIPDSVKVLEQDAFRSCYNLERIRIGNGIKKIGKDCFIMCTSLKEIKLPESLRDIDSGVFQFCFDLEQIEFNDQLRIIGESSFSSCRSLEYVTLPDSVENIEWEAFARCSKLKSVRLSKGLKYINGLFCFADCDSLQEILIPSSVPEKVYKKKLERHSQLIRVI